MTDFPDKKTSPPDTEPIPAADSMSATDAALTKPLEAADATATARLDYESPTGPQSPVDTEATPPSAAFAQARWARGNAGTRAPSAPPAQDITVPPAPVGPGNPGASPTPRPGSAPTAVPLPPVSTAGAGNAVGAGRPIGASRPVGAGAPLTRPPMARATAPARRRRPPRRRPRFGTILWGVLLLGFAAFMVARTVLPAPLDPTFWLLGGVILVGLLLVVAGIIAASRRAG